MKRALLGVLGVTSLCFSVAAQQTSGLDGSEDENITLEQLSFYRPEILNTLDSSALLQGLPMLSLLDDWRLPVSSELGRMGMAPLDLFPVAFLSAAPAQKVKKASQVDGKESPGDVISAPSDHYYYGGEVGFLYGRSPGKFGYEDFESYIVGEVGDDKFHISVGASYQELSGHGPRFHSFDR